MSRRTSGNNPPPTGISRQGGVSRPTGAPRTAGLPPSRATAGRPPSVYRQGGFSRPQGNPRSSGTRFWEDQTQISYRRPSLETCEVDRPHVHVPHHNPRTVPSSLRPRVAEQRSSSVPSRPTTSSRSNITTASRSGGTISKGHPAASSTMRSSIDQSFAPTVTSSKFEVGASRPKGIRSTIPSTSQPVTRRLGGQFAPKHESSRITASSGTSRTLETRRNVPPRLLSDSRRIPKTSLETTRTYNKDTSKLTVRPGVCPPSSRSTEPMPQSTSQVEDIVTDSLIEQATLKPKKKVTATGKTTYQRPPETLVTPAGREPLLQRSILEKRVERNQAGERIVKNVTLSNIDECSGMMNTVEVGIQQLDPKYPGMDGQEVLGVTSAISVTPEYTTVTKDYLRTMPDTTHASIEISPEEVSRLVEEERDDVNNTLRMMPPDLILGPGKYEIKQRLQQMRINSESVALLEQSIVKPEVTADEAQEDLQPEDVAAVMHTIETGIKPQSSPDEVFNSLFKEQPSEHFINLSSVAPGPLQDVVVPLEIPKDIHKEAINMEMTKLADKIIKAEPEDVPTTDIFSKVMEEIEKNPKKGKNNKRSFPLIQDERSLWVNTNLEHLVNIVGAEPVDVLDPFNLDELEKTGNLELELTNGVDYFVDTNPIQYMNRVQLRGTQPPPYFPGYIVASPELPELVKIAKSPDEVFALAWKSVRPKYFEEDSMMSFLE